MLYVGTDGVQDVPIIGLIARKEAYNPAWEKPSAGVLRRHVFGIRERVDHKGNILIPLERAELERLGDWIDEWRTGDPAQEWAVAVNLLFSYVDPAHEEAIGAYLSERFPDLPVSLSSHVCPIWREYQRSATVITDAFIKRIIDRFVGQVSADLRTAGIEAPLSLMKSNGGHLQAESAGDAPVQLLLSGLAGGVIAGARFAPRPRRGQRRHPGHGGHELRRRSRHRRRLRLHHRVRGGVGRARERALHRLHHHRRGGRLHRLRRRGRTAPRRAAQRRRRPGSRLLRPGRHRADRDRRQRGARPPRPRLLPGRRDDAGRCEGARGGGRTRPETRAHGGRNRARDPGRRRPRTWRTPSA